MKPRCAARLIECGLPAATHNGGCGLCAGGGSTTMSSKFQKRPWCEKRVRVVQALAHQRQRLLEARFGLLRRDVEALELAVAVALADAEIEAAVGDEIERRHLLGQSTGLCQGSTITAVPRRSVLVRMASAISSISVAETWFQPVK